MKPVRRPLPMLLLGLATIAYPLLVYLCLLHQRAQLVALLLLALALLRIAAGLNAAGWASATAALLLAAAVVWADSLLPAKLYPVAVNLLLLAIFGWSLAHPPSVVERIARLREPELAAAAVAYTRRVTMVWCGFFVANGGASLWTALYADDRIWALYNGLLAYLLMGLLFAGEWLVRRRVRVRHA